MKIFFVAVLMAVAAAAQVTLEDVARSYVRIGIEFNSMTDAEKREAMQSIVDDWWSAFSGDVYCGATVEDLNKILEDQINRVCLDSDYEEREAFNSINPAFWEAFTIKDVKNVSWEWQDNSMPYTLSRFAIFCHARQHPSDFGFCGARNGAKDRGAENRRTEDRRKNGIKK